MLGLRNPFKKRKNPDKVRAGQLGGIRSGEARRLKKADKERMDAVFDASPELSIIRDLRNRYGLETSDKQLLLLAPTLTAIQKWLGDREKPVIEYDY